jgi:cbb3-type cytochrome oxidase subunit 1
MWILTVYILIVVIMELIVVAIGLALDRTYPSLSLTISLFFAVLWLAWVVAVRVTEPKHTESKKHTG